MKGRTGSSMIPIYIGPAGKRKQPYVGRLFRNVDKTPKISTQSMADQLFRSAPRVAPKRP